MRILGDGRRFLDRGLILVFGQSAKAGSADFNLDTRVANQKAMALQVWLPDLVRLLL